MHPSHDSAPGSALDAAVFPAETALRAKGVAAPTALILSATGLGILPARLEGGRRIPLEGIPGVPPAWRKSILHWGSFQGLACWMIEDEPDDELPFGAAFEAGFPVWLAAAAGASAMIHTSAGHSLSDDCGVGTLALLSDHLNLSGSSVLLGLGESRLGPIFPDQTRVHDVELRRAARAAAARLGLVAVEAVGACTLGPAIDTPAERRWFAAAGAQVAVQRLAAPILAAAHAGLGTLCVVAITDAGEGPLDIAKVAATAGRIAPALDDFLWTLAGDVGRQAAARLEEGP